MRCAQQGKLWADVQVVLVVLVLCLAFFGFLLFGKRPHRTPPDVYQKWQFNAMNAAVELFANEFDGYPPSDANDPTGRPYCGAMKLVEALMGQVLLGFHTRSSFRLDGLDTVGVSLYPPDIDWPTTLSESNLKARNGPFLQAENANAWRLVDIYGKGNTSPFPEDAFVLCDTYRRPGAGGERTGMPILYYRVNPSDTAHDVVNPDNPQNIYHYQDNHALILLGVPGKPGERHPLADPKRFYLNTQDRKARSKSGPYRRDSFILISAGGDGLYGTADDVCNFEWKYRDR